MQTKLAQTGAADARGASTRAVSHNLNGQRLGRKGRDTQARILAVTAELLAEPAAEPLTLSAVARRASLGMTSLYAYFSDLTELLLAVLDPVMETAEAEYIGLLRERWPEAELGTRTLALVRAYHAFWVRHSRLLHLRNSMADSGDTRLMLHRVRAAQLVIRLLVEQMDADVDQPTSRYYGMATALMTGLDRVVTVTTNANLPQLIDAPVTPRAHLLEAEARLLELGIRDYRQLAEA